MDTQSLAIRVLLGVFIGFGFVTSSLGATLRYLGVSRPLAVLVGGAAGLAVFLLIVFRSERVRE
jgi:hypothetical protein